MEIEKVLNSQVPFREGLKKIKIHGRGGGYGVRCPPSIKIINFTKNINPSKLKIDRPNFYLQTVVNHAHFCYLSKCHESRTFYFINYFPQIGYGGWGWYPSNNEFLLNPSLRGSSNHFQKVSSQQFFLFFFNLESFPKTDDNSASHFCRQPQLR